MEKSLILIKPDAVERNLIGSIIAIYEQNGLKVTRLRMLTAERHRAIEHYHEHLGRPYFDKLIAYITRSPLVAIELQGMDVIARVRHINGCTDPSKAEPDTIRGRFGINSSENTVHASDSRVSAEREIAIWFGM